MMETLIEIGQLALDLFLDLIFPRRCPICDKPVKPTTEIHDECRVKIRPVTDNYCMKCGRPIKESGKEYCYDCGTRPHFFDKGRVAFEYDGVAQSIYRFKYNGRAEYARFFGEEIVKSLGEQIKEWNADAIIPVPIHKNRRKKRGYNQAELLAKSIGKFTKIPVRTDIVAREVDTKPLKLLNPSERQNNLKKAFKIMENDVKLKTLIIVDDIYTTGTTIDTVARELKENGVRSVCFVTITAGDGL